MNELYTLEKYTGKRSRYTCPNCGADGEFTRYINTQTGEYLSDQVGYCNRIINCGYHFSPRQYFSDYPAENRKTAFTQLQPKEKKEPSFIPEEIYERSLHLPTLFDKNNFVQYLVYRFGIQKTEELVYRFKIGSSTHWPGATVFWQIDISDFVRTGKVMLFDKNTCRRIKNPYPHLTWAHKILLKKNTFKEFNLSQCLFGLHQLSTKFKNSSTAAVDSNIGIVESEKTAVIASCFFPELTWLATGSIQNLSSRLLFPIASQKIILFPDLKAFEIWNNKKEKIEKELSIDISISDLLEKKASSFDLHEQFDLADYLLKMK